MYHDQLDIDQYTDISMTASGVGWEQPVFIHNRLSGKLDKPITDYTSNVSQSVIYSNWERLQGLCRALYSEIKQGRGQPVVEWDGYRIQAIAQLERQWNKIVWTIQLEI